MTVEQGNNLRYLITHLPIPDKVARVLFQDRQRQLPARQHWRIPIDQNPNCHQAIRDLTRAVDRDRIPWVTYHRGLAAGNEATLDLYLGSRTKDQKLSDMILNEWTLSAKDQVRFVQRTLSGKLLYGVLRHNNYAPEARLAAAKRMAKTKRDFHLGSVITWLENTADVYADPRMVAELVTLIRDNTTTWNKANHRRRDIRVRPELLVPDVPEVVDHLWNSYDRNSGKPPIWFGWTAAFGNTETANQIARWLLDPDTEADQIFRTHPVGKHSLGPNSGEDLTATQILAVRPDVDPDLRKQLHRYEPRLLDTAWIPRPDQPLVDLAQTVDLDTIRTTLRTLQEAAEKPAENQAGMSGVRIWYLRSMLAAGTNQAAVNNLDTATCLMTCLRTHVDQTTETIGAKQQSYQVVWTMRKLVAAHGEKHLPAAPSVWSREPFPQNLYLPDVSQHTGSYYADKTASRSSNQPLKDLADSAVVDWWIWQHLHCVYEREDECWKPFHKLGRILGDMFGDDVNKWRMFFGLVDACVEPTTTFQQLADTVNQLSGTMVPSDTGT